MDITISHGIYNGSIPEFNLYRGVIASLFGIVEKPEYLYLPELDKTDWSYINQCTDYFGYWKKTPVDPIWYLIAHTDNTGYIQAKHCAPLLESLSKIKIDTNSGFGGSIPNIHKSFIKGLKLAIAANEDVIIKQS